MQTGITILGCRGGSNIQLRQTTVSQQIAALENEFGLPLIDRKQIPIQPTKARWLFYGEALILWKQYGHM